MTSSTLLVKDGVSALNLRVNAIGVYVTIETGGGHKKADGEAEADILLLILENRRGKRIIAPI